MATAKIAFASQAEKTPLIVRAGLPRTFWTLGIFVEASLLFGGLYLLAEVTLRPLEADQISILSAGFILALAAILLVYLVRPWRKAALARMEDSPQAAAVESPLTAFGEAVRTRQEAERILCETEELPGPM
jgi:type VI protein secretion system component VasK